MTATIVGALIVWCVVSPIPALILGRVIRRADEADRRPAYPPLVPRPADDLPAWLFDQPSQPLTDDKFDRSEDILRGAV